MGRIQAVSERYLVDTNIVLWGWHEPHRLSQRQRSLLAGFHLHLSKPIEARELVASIAGLLHLSHS